MTDPNDIPWFEKVFLVVSAIAVILLMCAFIVVGFKALMWAVFTFNPWR